ncbi:hypothetical protein LEL_10737 [Akanthomyces lecanii RCEF 1005]|uniref:Uncharacterized protein n=1 Tax=Akanthomyces lecanii RCEF 1005 TaxID=1081108 RepID=A0A167UZT4_CORDF|nr:hypothetical protein LEL_10737 [Akanthomyces lecanii RCEF 1005]
MNEPITAENTAFADAKLRADTVGATAPTLEDNSICEPEQVTLPRSPTMEGNIHLGSSGMSEAEMNFFGSAIALGAMESILQHCVEVNYKFAKYKFGEAMVATKIEDIQSYASSMVDLGYDQAVYAVRKSIALAASQDVQVRYNESFYWDIIMKSVSFIDPSTLKNRGGPIDEFTQAEKEATKTFMDQAGFGTSSENQRQRRRIWKRLSDMRRAGADKILLYRTREFDKIREQNPKHDAIPLVERRKLEAVLRDSGG